MVFFRIALVALGSNLRVAIDDVGNVDLVLGVSSV